MNQNCLSQTCFQNCCNRYGYCIDRYSFDYRQSTCYYYYYGRGWAAGYIVLTVVGGLLVGFAVLALLYCCWRRSRRHHGMPYVQPVNVPVTNATPPPPYQLTQTIQPAPPIPPRTHPQTHNYFTTPYV